MSEFQGFQRKTFSVSAARVTPQNIEELAEACGGKVMHDGEKEGNYSRDYIKVRVAYPLNDEQTKARVGDWLVKQGRNFKVYKDRPFRNSFELADGSPVPQQPKPKVEQHEHDPSPSDMPKKMAESTPGPEVLSADEIARLEHISNGGTPEAAPITEEVIEQAPAEGTTPETIEEAPVFPENSPAEELVEQPVTEEAEVPTSDGREPEREQLGDDELREAGFPTSTDPDYQVIYRDEVEAGAVPVQEKKSITLEELNDQPGDPRSAQEIMNER